MQEEKTTRRRFDHFLASNGIEVISAEYNHLNNKLSELNLKGVFSPKNFLKI